MPHITFNLVSSSMSCPQFMPSRSSPRKPPAQQIHIIVGICSVITAPLALLRISHPVREGQQACSRGVVLWKNRLCSPLVCRICGAVMPTVRSSNANVIFEMCETHAGVLPAFPLKRYLAALKGKSKWEGIELRASSILLHAFAGPNSSFRHQCVKIL